METEIIIDPEFRDLIPPLSDAELEQLHNSLTAYGCRDPLIVWKGQNILLDGHNRYAYCKAKGIPFKIDYLRRSSRDVAKNFIILNQLGRRNLAPDAAAMLRGKLYRARKKKSAGRSDREFGGATLTPPKTAEDVAKETGVSASTVKRDGKFAEAVEYLKLDQDVMSGAEKRSRAAIIKAAESLKIDRGEMEPKKPREPQKRRDPYKATVASFKRLDYQQMEKAIKEIDEIWKSL